MMDRLVLGTAQLGMVYGINNKVGKPDFNRAKDIVKTAFENGIVHFDTAQAYGDSEEVLGKVFGSLGLTGNAKVYSKLHPKLDLGNGRHIRRSIDGSLRRLKLDQLEGLFLHREEGLDFWDGGLRATLQDLVAQGKIRAVGVSCYAPEKALSALAFKGIDLLQVPANIFDRRFETCGVFSRARNLKKEVFVRSVFLQGLLLMPEEAIPLPLAYMRKFVKDFADQAKSLNVSRQELAVGYVKQRYPESFFVVGAEDREQIMETARLFRAGRSLDIPNGTFENIPENVLNPALWLRS